LRGKGGLSPDMHISKGHVLPGNADWPKSAVHILRRNWEERIRMRINVATDDLPRSIFFACTKQVATYGNDIAGNGLPWTSPLVGSAEGTRSFVGVK